MGSRVLGRHDLSHMPAHRPLAPGVYNITAVMPGYANETRAVAVPEDGSGAFLEFYLEPLAGAAGALAQWAALPRRFGVFGGGGAGAEEAEQVRSLKTPIASRGTPKDVAP